MQDKIAHHLQCNVYILYVVVVYYYYYVVVVVTMRLSYMHNMRVQGTCNAVDYFNMLYYGIIVDSYHHHKITLYHVMQHRNMHCMP